MLQAGLEPIDPAEAKETRLSNSKGNASNKDVDVSCRDSNNNDDDNKDVCDGLLHICSYCCLSYKGQLQRAVTRGSYKGQFLKATP
jgi:hypothetical protein